MLVLTLSEFLQEEKTQRKMLVTVAAVSILVCLYGLFQLAGLDFFTWEVPAGSGRSTLSTLGRRNFTAEYLVAVVPLIFFLWTRSDCRKEKILAGISFSSGVVTLFLSFTRASYLGFFASFLVAAAFLFRGKVAFQKTFILLAVVVFFRSGLAAGQPMGFDPTSVKSRLLIWKAALAMVKEKPLTGVGANNFEFVYLPYAKKAKGLLPVAERVANAHNDYLEVAAEQGVLGLAALFWLIFVLINTGLEVRKKGNRQQQFFTVAALSSCAGILINSLAAFPFKNPSVLQILAFNLAILTVFHHQVRKKGGCSVAIRPATVRIISAVSLTVFSLSAAASLASSYLLKKALRLMSSAGETQDPVSWALAENSGRKAVLFNPYSLEAHFYLGRIYLSGNYPELAREEL
ncbi:MAG TPA: O-antigen ligase family protein, partial [bacterium]|nr:O-antigen ligase family protein [bacterium]